MSLVERLAREARLRNDGFIDCCHPSYCEAPEPHPLCPACEAIERVARHAIRAALADAAQVARTFEMTPKLSPTERIVRSQIAAAIEAL